MAEELQETIRTLKIQKEEMRKAIETQENIVRILKIQKADKKLIKTEIEKLLTLKYRSAAEVWQPEPDR